MVIPAYNEEERLPKMLDECLPYLTERSKQDPFCSVQIFTFRKFTWEAIIVDDGSKDRTKDVAYAYIKKYNNPNIRVLVEVHNRGKGGAIRLVEFSGSVYSRERCRHEDVTF